MGLDSACARGLLTVKTCIDIDLCRFGMQDSMGLGIRLVKALWGSCDIAKGVAWQVRIQVPVKDLARTSAK